MVSALSHVMAGCKPRWPAAASLPSYGAQRMMRQVQVPPGQALGRYCQLGLGDPFGEASQADAITVIQFVL